MSYFPTAAAQEKSKKAKGFKFGVAKNAAGQWEWQIGRQGEYNLNLEIFCKICKFGIPEMVPLCISQDDGGWWGGTQGHDVLSFQVVV